jgi:hypothetical protein
MVLFVLLLTGDAVPDARAGSPRTDDEVALQTGQLQVIKQKQYIEQACWINSSLTPIHLDDDMV